MSYENLAEGLSKEEAAQRISEVMPSRRNISSINAESPPSVFVGSSNYPQVSLGVLSPPIGSAPQMFDDPKQWKDRNFTIKRIASLRGSLVNSFEKTSVTQVSNSLNPMRELAMAEKPTNIEAELSSSVKDSRAGRIKPVSSFGETKEFNLGENPSVDRQVEKIYYDRDADAETAVRELKNSDKSVYDIQKAFSAGLVGLEKNRKLVPTRWSITAVDDIISQDMREKTRAENHISKVRYFSGEFLGNEFDVFLLPGIFEFELIELKRPDSTWNDTATTKVKADSEGTKGREDYASQTAGAYYAARSAVLEYLRDQGIQAKVLVVRDVRPDYYAPLGVWVVREGIRKTMTEFSKMENEKQIKEHLSRKFTIQYPKIYANSDLLQGKQKSVDSYLS